MGAHHDREPTLQIGIIAQRLDLDAIGQAPEQELGCAQGRRRRSEALPPRRPQAIDVEALEGADFVRRPLSRVGLRRHHAAPSGAMR
jgi:hypothetical protein